MQIRLSDSALDRRRIDFHGNSVDGVFVQLVDREGFTHLTKELTEEERLRLIDTLTRKDNGRAV